MALSKDEIQHIAVLAQLEIGPSVVDEMTEKLSRIVAFVDQLQATDLTGVQPMAHPLDVTTRLRPDEVTENIDRDRYQENAEKVADGLYLVPKVID